MQKVGLGIKPFTNTLLKLLFPVAKEEKSGSSKRAFANACAAVLRFAAPSQAQKLIEDTAALRTGDRNDQISGAILLKSYSSLANDALGGYRVVVLPVIFVSRLLPLRKLCFFFYLESTTTVCVLSVGGFELLSANMYCSLT